MDKTTLEQKLAEVVEAVERAKYLRFHPMSGREEAALRNQDIMIKLLTLLVHLQIEANEKTAALLERVVSWFDPRGGTIEAVSAGPASDEPWWGSDEELKTSLKTYAEEWRATNEDTTP